MEKKTHMEQKSYWFDIMQKENSLPMKRDL